VRSVASGAFEHAELRMFDFECSVVISIYSTIVKHYLPYVIHRYFRCFNTHLRSFIIYILPSLDKTYFSFLKFHLTGIIILK
jgi:hypothetical protein